MLKKHATSFCFVLNLPFACKQQLCRTAFCKYLCQQNAEGQRAKHQQYVGKGYLFNGHDNAEMVIGAAEPVQKQRMHKVDEHRISGKGADGFVEKVGEGTPLSPLAVTAPPKGSLCM